MSAGLLCGFALARNPCPDAVRVLSRQFPGERFQVLRQEHEVLDVCRALVVDPGGKKKFFVYLGKERLGFFEDLETEEEN
jgi:hypothetical protein